MWVRGGLAHCWQTHPRYCAPDCSHRPSGERPPLWGLRRSSCPESRGLPLRVPGHLGGLHSGPTRALPASAPRVSEEAVGSKETTTPLSPSPQLQHGASVGSCGGAQAPRPAQCLMSKNNSWRWLFRCAWGCFVSLSPWDSAVATSHSFTALLPHPEFPGSEPPCWSGSAPCGLGVTGTLGRPR